MKCWVMWKLLLKTLLWIIVLSGLMLFADHVIGYASKISFEPQNPKVNESVCFSWEGWETVYSWTFWNNEGYRRTVNGSAPCVNFPKPGKYFVTVRYWDWRTGENKNLVTEIQVSSESNQTPKIPTTKTIKPVILFDETRLLKRTADSYKEGSGYEFAIGETAWYGASTFAQILRDQGYEVRALKDRPITPTALTGVDVLVILEPYNDVTPPYSSFEIQAISEFVKNGGGLFLAERSWRGSEGSSGGVDVIARAFGVSFKGNGEIDDPTDHFGDKLHTIKISRLEKHPITEGVGSYYFDRASYLDVLGNAEVVAFSDVDSWFDQFSSDNWGDHKRQPGEKTGPFPVLAVMNYGDGRIVFAGNGIIMMNGWIDDLDDKKLALNIIDWLLKRAKPVGPRPSAMNRPPIASFTFSPTNPDTVTSIKFDASGSHDPDGVITRYLWDFGDGTSETGILVRHTYSRPGQYRVTLTVIDNQNTSDNTYEMVEVKEANQLPIADFTFSPANPDTSTSVRFDASSSHDPDGIISHYAWDFGDGTLAVGILAHHTYTHPGKYRATLTVIDNGGLTDNTYKWITIRESNQPPIAQFTTYTLGSTGERKVGAQLLLGAQVWFDASISSDPDGTITKYEWDWDSDGSYDVSSKDPVIGHIFTQPGIHEVTLRVTDDKGATAKVTKTITVGVNKPPIAAFTMSDSHTVITWTVTFDASNSSDPDGSIVKYEWEFGDETTGKGNVVTHAFSTPGTYTVKLTVTDNDGASASIEKVVKVFRYGGEGGPA